MTDRERKNLKNQNDFLSLFVKDLISIKLPPEFTIEIFNSAMSKVFSFERLGIRIEVNPFTPHNSGSSPITLYFYEGIFNSGLVTSQVPEIFRSDIQSYCNFILSEVKGRVRTYEKVFESLLISKEV